MNLPGYDAWKTDLSGTPYEGMTPEQEDALEVEQAAEKQNLRDAIACALADERGDIYLADIRQIVIEELNKLRPLPGEPAWQTATAVPVPALG